MEYTIVTFDRFVEIHLSNTLSDEYSIDIIKRIEDNWDSIRNGYNFVIAVGDYTNPMFYSVPYFNNNIVQNRIVQGGEK